jgi:hypothetical protein
VVLFISTKTEVNCTSSSFDSIAHGNVVIFANNMSSAFENRTFGQTPLKPRSWIWGTEFFIF